LSSDTPSAFRSFTLPFILLLAALAAVIIHSAVFDPDSCFLPPATRGEWLLAPHRIDKTLVSHYRSAVFRKEKILPAEPARVTAVVARIKAATDCEVFVNGQLLPSPSKDAGSPNWRWSRSFDLRPYLRPSANTLALKVTSNSLTPALLFNADVSFDDGSRRAFDSDPTWLVSVDDGGHWSAPEKPEQPREFWPGHLDYFSSHPAIFARLRIASFAATMLFMCLAVALCRPLFPSRATDRFAAQGEFAASPLGCRPPVAAFLNRVPGLAFAFLYFPLALLRDPYSGWDAEIHINYIQHVAAHWSIPFSGAGSRMYQPPAYYFLAACIYRLASTIPPGLAQQLSGLTTHDIALKAVQLLSPVLAWLQVLTVRRTLSFFFPAGSPALALGVVFAALLPMQIYSSQFISSEMFSSLTISVGLCLLVSMILRNRIRNIRWCILLGLAIGLACLTKYTGALLLASAAMVYGSRSLQDAQFRRRTLIGFLVLLAAFAAAAGPYYYANLRRYGTPFHFPQHASAVTLEYRGIGFFLNPLNLGLGAIDKFEARTLSFPDGNYSSMWLDISNLPHTWTRIADGIIYYLALFPAILMLFGMVRLIRLCASDAVTGERSLPLVAFFFLSVGAYCQFVLRFFSWEVVKAFYILSSISAFALFFSVGLEKLLGQPERGRRFLALLAMLSVAIVAYFGSVLLSSLARH